MLLHGVDPLVPNILKEDGIDATKRKVKLKRRGKESAFADVSNHIVSELQPISSSQLAPTVMT